MMPSIIRRMLTAVTALLICGLASAQEQHVQEIPFPQEAKEISYSKSRGDIRMTFPKDMKAAGEFYRNELTKNQWTKSGKDNVQARFWVQTFKKGNLELVIRTENRGSGCDIRVTPKGFLWDEDLAPRPQDIPVPEDAANVNYDDFFQRIEFEHKSSFKEMVEYYNTKLPEKTWAKSGEDSVRSESAALSRKSGKASLVIRIEAKEEGCSVEIKTKGMSWDEIKLANAAKKMKEKDSPDTPSGTKAKVPARPDKAKKDIAKLEKLKSIGSVTIDGKKTELTEVIAYELIAYGEWRTHIVASARPVKTKALLELLASNVPEEDWDSKWEVPAPYIKLVLDADDSLRSMQLYAEKVPGSSTSVKGEAVVEAGRARGKAQLEQQSFFEHTYEAEITFDTQLINGTPPDNTGLANAPKLENSGKIILAGTPHSLPHITAYQAQQSDRMVTHVLLTEKRVESDKILAALTKSNEVDLSLVGIQRQIDLTFNENDQLVSVFLYCDGNSINWSGNDKVEADVQSDDNRVRGTTKTTAAEEVFGKTIEIQASFDTTILRAAKDSK